MNKLCQQLTIVIYTCHKYKEIFLTQNGKKNKAVALGSVIMLILLLLHFLSLILKKALSILKFCQQHC